MSRQIIMRRGPRYVTQDRATHNHIVTTCVNPFVSGDKAQAIASLRKLAKHMSRRDISIDKNLNPIYANNCDNFAKVFLGFDSPPLCASPEWMDFQPKYKGPNAPIIDNIFVHSRAGTLSFMTDDQGIIFVHMHKLGQGRSVRCTSPVCYQQYKVKDFNQKEIQEYYNRAQGQKRKRIPDYDVTGAKVSIAKRRRVSFDKKTFEALSDQWERGFEVRMKFPNPDISYNLLPLDLKVMIWDCMIPERTVIINPYFLPGCQRVLCIDSKTKNSVLFRLNQESREFLAGSAFTIRLVDSYGPSLFYLNTVKDTILLLSLGFLRTRSLPGFDKIAEPFSKVRKLAIPWTSTCFSATHVAFMPAIFQSLETLTLLGFEDELSAVAKWDGKIDMSPATGDFRHYKEMLERQGWIQEVFQNAGRSIDTQLKCATHVKKERRSVTVIVEGYNPQNSIGVRTTTFKVKYTEPVTPVDTVIF